MIGLSAVILKMVEIRGIGTANIFGPVATVYADPAPPIPISITFEHRTCASMASEGICILMKLRVMIFPGNAILLTWILGSHPM